MKRCRTKQIRGLEDSNGVWQECESGIRATTTSYFSNLFWSSRPNQINEIGVCLENQRSLEDNLALTAD